LMTITITATVMMCTVEYAKINVWLHISGLPANYITRGCIS
jgi:hypothetical protein